MTNRNTVTVVEIDIDQCARTYGSAPCTAALSSGTPDKCFNTYRTCQDTDNYSAASVLTLTFAEDVGGLKPSKTVFPHLRSVSTRAARLNVSGADDYSGPLGRRERVTVVMSNAKYQDTLTDPYQSERLSGTAQNSGTGYNPLDQGTFWGKFLARNYYTGRPLRVKYGNAGDDYSSMTTHHYVIDEIVGPSADGTVTIHALGIMSLAEDKKAMCPVPSRGILDRDITETDTTFTLRPAGIGSEYSTNSKASIGAEIVSFTRSGDDITLTARGQGGTDAVSHSINDLFQECYHCTNALISEVAAELLETYGNVPSSYVANSTWDTEAETWLPGLLLTTIIPRPVYVPQLLAELGELGIYLWEDTENQTIEFRLNRYVDVDESVTTLTDDDNFLERSVSVENRMSGLLTRVIFNYAPENFAGSMTSGENFRRAEAILDADAEQSNAFDLNRTRIIFSRWVDETSENAVRSIASRILGRFNEVPRYITFSVDEGDVSNVAMASYIEVQTSQIETATGENDARQCQVVSMEKTRPGHRARVVAQEVVFRAKLGYIMLNSANDYGSATATEKTDGAYIADADGTVDGDDPYVVG